MSDGKTRHDLIPYTQITIKLQGTHHTSREDILAQLNAVAASLSEGDDAGEFELEGCGYTFETKVTLTDPSIFSEERELPTGSLRATIAQAFGQQALSRLDEMQPVHRAALERRFGFVPNDGKNLRFLNGAHEKEVQEEAMRRLLRPSKAEQLGILRAMGLDDEKI